MPPALPQPPPLSAAHRPLLNTMSDVGDDEFEKELWQCLEDDEGDSQDSLPADILDSPERAPAPKAKKKNLKIYPDDYLDPVEACEGVPVDLSGDNAALYRDFIHDVYGPDELARVEEEQSAEPPPKRQRTHLNLHIPRLRLEADSGRRCQARRNGCSAIAALQFR